MAGPPTPPQQVARMMEEFPNARLGNGFGLTETSSVATFLTHEYALERPETVGFAVPVVELDLDDVDPRSGAGELLIRGPNVVAGYWAKLEADGRDIAGGWLHSGDIALFGRRWVLYGSWTARRTWSIGVGKTCTASRSRTSSPAIPVCSRWRYWGSLTS